MLDSLTRITPIDIVNGEPTDPKLHAAVQAYAEKEFGAPIVFSYHSRVWAILLLRQGDADYFQVIGVTAIRQTLDCPVFHITPPSMDKDGLRIAEQARDMAVIRMFGYLEDWGQKGNVVLIHVSETAVRFWQKFLNKIKAKPANRFEIFIK